MLRPWGPGAEAYGERLYFLLIVQQRLCGPGALAACFLPGRLLCGPGSRQGLRRFSRLLPAW